MKKIDNRGFTLVELLAVIVILIVIVSIAIPTISASIQRTNEKQKENKKKLLFAASELYLSDHRKIRNDFYDGSCYIDVRSLINDDYVSEDDIKHNGELIYDYVYYDIDNDIMDAVGDISGVNKCN